MAIEVKSCMNFSILTARVMKVVISKSIINHWFTQKISLKSVYRRMDQVSSEKSCDNSR